MFIAFRVQKNITNNGSLENAKKENINPLRGQKIILNRQKMFSGDML